MAQYNLPIWLHPWRTPAFADYKTRRIKGHVAFSVWLVHETTAAMTLGVQPDPGEIPHAENHHPSLWGSDPNPLAENHHGVDGEEMTKRGR
jgi:hypothetical protein